MCGRLRGTPPDFLLLKTKKARKEDNTHKKQQSLGDFFFESRGPRLSNGGAVVWIPENIFLQLN